MIWNRNLKATLIAGTFCVNSVFAAEFVPVGYSNDESHSSQTLTDVGVAGMVLGFTTLGVLLIYALIMMVKDHVDTHKKYNSQLFNAINTMRTLGLNIQQVDQQYEKSLKNKNQHQQKDEKENDKEEEPVEELDGSANGKTNRA
ncbi:UNKNOWN [Stylonychia lemnae]|uniref:Uncharacterized protein n=1 Tax=Stylonychia lemnae TaxID=5949 RepID=A0A078AH68_STYLE|nr:UNKNOWN [Stylonychia lemnae]|eukprot:CDW81176.1 UNKNOWN [Stylonychia lemnae]